MFRIIKKLIRILFCCIAVSAGMLGYARFIEPELLTVKSLTVETDNNISPCRIIFFSDLHLGKYYDEAHLDRIVNEINGLNADFVFFGGDLFDNYARDYESLDFEYIRKKLSEIRVAVSKYAVWGNHDYGGGAVRIYEDFLSSCGFEVLNDESRLFKDYGIKIFGYDDYLMGWTDPELYTIDSDYFNIIVAHEPVISQFIESNSGNFLLAGHTHGGQVTIPFLTDEFLPEGSGEFRKGFYSAEETGRAVSLQMYVSSGIGMTRYPFRFLNIPEIVEINFVPGVMDRIPAAAELLPETSHKINIISRKKTTFVQRKKLM